MSRQYLIIILLSLASLGLTFTIQPLDESLQMTNFTGSKLTANMSKKFVDIIKKSFSYHHEDIIGNAEYVRSEIQRVYQGNYCSVMIFQKNTTGGHYLMGNGVVAIWTKVIPQKPEWIYVISCNNQKYGQDVVTGAGAGSGVNATKQNILNNVIKRFQTTYSSCFGLTQMSKNLQDYDGNIWNIMCFQKNNTIHASLNDFGRSYYVPNLYENFRNYYLLYSFKATK